MKNIIEWPTNRIRAEYLDFFQRRGHQVVSSDGLAPQSDATLLFTGAGMNQFKNYFLGVKRDMKRATSSQKCLRTGDLDHVGRTPYHQSFFEMLGNFSFGDYFKEEAISWAVELLTKNYHISNERLRVSVHCDDSETYSIWHDKIGVPEKCIAKFGDGSNFWPANAPAEGPNGPCGPCSEIFYDQGNIFGCGRRSGCDVDCDCGRFAEIWNLVFTQYDRRDGGELAPLGSKNIDTGAGLERLACILQGKTSNFEIDILSPLLDFVGKELAGNVELTRSDRLIPARAIVDHCRAATFAIADGVMPSNEGRGYVVRKLIRRAIWKGQKFLFEGSRAGRSATIYKLAEKIAEVMKDPYPYLLRELSSIQTVLKGEEERFLETLEDGQRMLERVIGKVMRSGARTISAEDAFKLYDTYGFPDELTIMIARDHHLDVDIQGFQRLMDDQRRRAREATKITDAIFVSDSIHPDLRRQSPTKFLGYESLDSEASVLFVDIDENEGWIVLDQTPFYAERGGQVGDRGMILGPHGRADVLDAQWKEKWILHRVSVKDGTIKTGERVKVRVDEKVRERTRRHHTATHLLQASLRAVLGSHVRQLGSLVNAEKLRFDFSHPKPLTPDEVRGVEIFINSAILKNLPVVARQSTFEGSQREGVLAFFGDKYDECVRILDIGNGLSKELCGGTHVTSTGDIGSVVITSEASIASGTRRIEAVAGMAAVEYVQATRDRLTSAAAVLKVPPEDLANRISTLQEKLKSAPIRPSGSISSDTTDNLAASSQNVQGIDVVVGEFPDLGIKELRALADTIGNKIAGESVAVLFAVACNSVSFVVASKSVRIDACHMTRRLAELLAGSGGGTSRFAQGGTKRVDLLQEAKSRTVGLINDILQLSKKP